MTPDEQIQIKPQSFDVYVIIFRIDAMSKTSIS